MHCLIGFFPTMCLSDPSRSWDAEWWINFSPIICQDGVKIGAWSLIEYLLFYGSVLDLCELPRSFGWEDIHTPYVEHTHMGITSELSKSLSPKLPSVPLVTNQQDIAPNTLWSLQILLLNAQKKHLYVCHSYLEIYIGNMRLTLNILLLQVICLLWELLKSLFWLKSHLCTPLSHIYAFAKNQWFIFFPEDNLHVIS